MVGQIRSLRSRWTMGVVVGLLATWTPAGAAECDDLAVDSLRQAIDQSLVVLSKQPKKPLVRAGSQGAYVAHVLRPLRDSLAQDSGQMRCQFIAGHFQPVRLGRPGQVLITGYHTPSVPGSLQQTARFRYPLYRRPPDFVRCPSGQMGRGDPATGACIDSYYTAGEILAGALAGRGLELVWLEDPYDVFALHIEGSGRIELPDGSSFQIGTNGHNGLPYQNISKLLAQDGKMPSGPAPPANRPGNPKARKYFTEHPEELPVYWGKSPHYVFFHETRGVSGKLGPLTAHRSIAVDTHLVPLGAVLVLQGQKPVISAGTVTGFAPFSRLVVAQDTGSAIVSEERVDLYFGEDMDAQVAASAMSQRGNLFLLIPR